MQGLQREMKEAGQLIDLKVPKTRPLTYRYSNLIYGE